MRPFISTVVAGCLLTLAATTASAQGKLATLVVPYSPGGVADRLARVIAQEMDTKFGLRMIVENRPGAGSQVAMSAVKNAGPSSGLVLFMADASAFSLNQSLYKRLNYDVDKDLIPLTLVANAGPIFLLVSNSSPFQNVHDLLTASSRQPVSFGSPGVGTATHLLGELLQLKTGANLVHVPYKGAIPALLDTVSGHVDFVFDLTVGAGPFLKDGRLRALAVARPERVAQFPEVPTLSESGVSDVSMGIWWGIAARSDMPPAEVQQIARQLREVLLEPEVIKPFAAMGLEIHPTSPEEFAALIQTERDSAEGLIRSLNITLE